MFSFPWPFQLSFLPEANKETSHANQALYIAQCIFATCMMATVCTEEHPPPLPFVVQQVLYLQKSNLRLIQMTAISGCEANCRLKTHCVYQVESTSTFDKATLFGWLSKWGPSFYSSGHQNGKPLFDPSIICMLQQLHPVFVSCAFFKQISLEPIILFTLSHTSRNKSHVI